MKKWFVVEFGPVSLDGTKSFKVGVLAYTYAEAVSKAFSKCPARCPWSCQGCVPKNVWRFYPVK